jgi:zona occludens toxin
MSVDALTGLPGGGKSYQAVVEIILPALAKGRRVVTNIEGLKDDAIYDRLEKWGCGQTAGEIIHVTDSQVASDDFYYCPPEDLAKLGFKPERQSIVQGGDLVVIDEAWAFYEKDVSDVVMNFFRKHRHFVNKENIACNVVLISQDVMDIGLKVRRIIATTTVTTKLEDVGLSSKYLVKIFKKFDLRQEPTFEGYGTYKPDNYALYDSYSFKSEQDKKSNHTGIERKSDKRNSVWSNKSIRYGLPIAIIILFTMIYKISNFFTSKIGDPQNKVAQVAPPVPITAAPPQTGFTAASQSQTSPAFKTNVSNPSNTNNQGVNPPAPVIPKEPRESTSVGVQGYYQVGNQLFVALKIGDKQRVIVDPKDFKIQDGVRIEGIFQNEIVNTYTGKDVSLKREDSPTSAGLVKQETNQKISNTVN